MSSLGDLLLGDIPEPVQSPQAELEEKKKEHKYNDNREQNDIKPKISNRSPSDASNEAHSNGQHQRKVFPERIIKKEIEFATDANKHIGGYDDDRRSNASSTDDLVRELLDPNDRPRNVWHVVKEGEEKSPDSQPHFEKEQDSDREERRSNDFEEPSDMNSDVVDGLRDNDRDESGNHERANRDEDTRQSDNSHYSRSRDIKEEQRQDDRYDRHRSRDHDRHRDRDHHHRRRSSDKHSRSRTKRSKYSDDDNDDDDDRNYKRHRGSRSKRHDSRRSRSRSRSRDSSRRRHHRHRSRSRDSRSPVTKRDARTILVMQLSPRVCSRDLEEYFEEVGRVKEVRLIMDGKTRRHKGIAYIEFDSASTVSKALALNGQKFHGAPLLIQSALSDRDKTRGGADYLGTSSSSHNHQSHHHSSSHTNTTSHYSTSRSNQLPPNSYRVYMGGLHVGITDEMLRTLVEPFGPVVRVELIKDRTTGLSRGYAFVTYANAEDGQEAIKKLDGLEVAGKNLRVSKSTEKSEH